jgi:lipopolysaccharide/colanic/teichoic acid biosynthesis glycosyltransferase
MRLVDIAAGVMGLIILSPVLLGLALWVKLSSSGSIFYRAKRVGRGGQPFYLYKFRTMVMDADRRGPGITRAGDDRITSAGQFLRRTKLDELPQLLNVLKGEMSLVGPRPEDPRYVALYTPEQLAVLQVRPGITSVASLHYRQEADLLGGRDWETVYTQEILPHKLAFELNYLQQRTLWRDLQLIWQTILSLRR